MRDEGKRDLKCERETEKRERDKERERETELFISG